METITKKIDGVDFFITQTPGRKVLSIEKKTVELLLPILGKIVPENEEDKKKLSKGNFLDVDISGAISAFQGTLSSLSDEEFENYIFSMIEYTRASLVDSESKKKVIVELNDKDKYDLVFTGISTLTLYKLLFEIMKINRFAVFELVGGLGINLTSFFSTVKKKINKSLTELETSESSSQK